MRQIPLHAIHESMGAKMVPFAGFLMPLRYSSDIDEHNTVRQGVGVFDVSHMGEFYIKGHNALGLIQQITSNDASKLVDGQAQYACLPNETGGIIDDLIIYKINDQNYMLVVNAANIEKDWNWILKHNNAHAEMVNMSDDLCLFAVQGPKAISVLQPLTAVALAAIPYYHFVQHTLANVADVMISNTGYTGAGGFEIYCHRKHAEKIWRAIFDAGKSMGIKPIGLGARDTLRLEMGFCLYGNDIDDTTSPLEAGLGWVTKFTKIFTNSENLKKQKEEGVKRKLIGFKMLEKGIPRRDYPIENGNGQVIGKVTSGSQSPTLGTGIGLGYVAIVDANPKEEIYIIIRDHRLKAEVIKLPFLSKEF